jgi:hypothetical protein
MNQLLDHGNALRLVDPQLESRFRTSNSHGGNDRHDDQWHGIQISTLGGSLPELLPVDHGANAANDDPFDRSARRPDSTL